MIRTLLLLILIAAFAVVSPAAKAQQGVARQMTNETVVSLTKAGLSPAVIVGKIRTSSCMFDTTPEELVRLRKLGVANDVLEVMLSAPASSDAGAAPEPARLSRSPVPSSAPVRSADLPNEPGIFVARDGKLEKLEPTVYSRSKTGGLWKTALTYGIAKAQFKAVLSSPRANYQLGDPRPTFYFCFEVKHSGLSDSSQTWQTSTTSPNEFVLLTLDEKSNSREVVVGEASAYSAQTGALEKTVCPISFEKIEPGLYRVTPREPLPDGEYAFRYAAESGGGYGFFWGGQKVFDFGIRRDR